MERRLYQPPAIIYEGQITIRAGTSASESQTVKIDSMPAFEELKLREGGHNTEGAKLEGESRDFKDPGFSDN